MKKWQPDTHPCVSCRGPSRLAREGAFYIVVCDECGISDFQGDGETEYAVAYSLWKTGKYPKKEPKRKREKTK